MPKSKRAVRQPPAQGAEGLTVDEERFKAEVVATILDARTEEAIDMLSARYRVAVPALKVGVLEGRTKGVAAVYSVQRREILAAKREYLFDPFVMVHEFYHHLRSISGKHRGTEKEADIFALGFLDAYGKHQTKVGQNARGFYDS